MAQKEAGDKLTNHCQHTITPQKTTHGFPILTVTRGLRRIQNKKESISDE